MKERFIYFVKTTSFLYKMYLYAFYYPEYLFYRYIVKKQFRCYEIFEEVSFVDLPVKRNSFFGYYNISPFNGKGELLWCETPENRTRGGEYSSVDIVHYNVVSDHKRVVGTTTAWNWQQGCMLQWFADSDHKIIYNIYDEIHKEYYSEITDLLTNKKKRLCKPIYSVAEDGSFALTLNYDRNTKMRPSYGYFRKQNIDLPHDSHDGVWFIDIEENTSRLIISLDELINHDPDPTMPDSRHKVNHIDIAPDGKRFMFLHRWIGPKGRFHRLFTANCIDGTDLCLLAGKELVSHNCWMTDSINIVSFSRMDDGRDRYNRYADQQGYVKTIGENDFLEDGHPSISPDGRWMLTDDYPDTAKFSRLYLYDLIHEEKYVIGQFHQPFRYRGENRVDLHPKWSKDGMYVSIDSGHSGKREFYVIDVSRITKH